jgi:ligand-binding sensor domain-containing protein
VKSYIKIILITLFLFICHSSFSQIDYSSEWEDFYSYNNVKDFIKINSTIYAIVDNAAFIYDLNTNETQKISSIHGLSGKETSSIFYSTSTDRFVIGYESGLLEIIDDKGKITIANDIERLDITGLKQINQISEFEDNLYLSTPFGIVQYDIVNLNFGDTYYIDENSSAVFVNQTAILQNTIYAATKKGIYSANLTNPNLIDFNNWTQPQGDLLGEFSSISIFNSDVITSQSNSLYRLTGSNNLGLIDTYPETIINIKSSTQFLTVASSSFAYVLNTAWVRIYVAAQSDTHPFSLNTAYADEEGLNLGTTTFGILKNNFIGSDYTEIHPNGPTSNLVFSITADNNNLWVVYGGYNASYTPLSKRLGYSHFNGNLEENKEWINTPYNSDFPALDLVHVTIDPENENKVYISSWNSGILVVQDDEPDVLWNVSNSDLEDLYPEGSPNSSIRINGSAFDNQGNFWVTNSWVDNRLKKLNRNGRGSSFSLHPYFDNPAFGLNELVIDKVGSIWIGSRRNGALVFNESGNRKKALKTEVTKGSLPDLNVRTLVVDRNNRIWIGTQKGLVVFSDPEGIFDDEIYDAEPVIVEDDGVPKKLLGDQPINSIAIDGAENKWFATDTGGVLGTNPSGSETLFTFNKDNSPLPSNRILKVKVDNSNGKVYFATDKGIVAFNNNVAPFGETLEEVYAYPNPVTKENEIVTIDGRNGTHLPRGTNVKILDTAGRLVYETNVEIGQEIKGGKVIWNKKNLSGNLVASGVYIVLLTSPDKSESTSTKIAIIN